MLVSAISATHSQISQPVNYAFINSRGGENGADPTFNNFVITNRKAGLAADDNDIYKSINEWKAFCHKQIASGKLNIIA